MTPASLPPLPAAPLLEVRDLRLTLKGGVAIVRGVSFSVEAEKVVGIVGESGSGKSMTVRALMNLLPEGGTVSGSVRLRRSPTGANAARADEGEELVGASGRRWRELRGSRLGMIFQDPMTALNPVLRVGDLVAEAVRLHQPGLSRGAARRRARELLERVSVPQPEVRARQYVHEFSGGMRQRAMIAIATANNPDVLIADEPTTALDVTVQAQILEMLQKRRAETGAGLILITHDLGVVASVADTVLVMYAGKIVESGAVRDIFRASRHPYTRGLLSCLPSVSGPAARLVPIPGNPPSATARPAGCPFHPRCFAARDICSTVEPELRPAGRVSSACHFADEMAALPTGRAPMTAASA